MPVAFRGSEQFRHRVRRLRRTPVDLRVGRPLDVARVDGPVRREERRAIVDRIMREIASLLDDEQRGVYG
jgi:hypothetical protein